MIVSKNTVTLFISDNFRQKYWFSGAEIPYIQSLRHKNLLMRLSAPNLACYQSGVEIIHRLNLTCGVTFKTKFFNQLFNSLKSSTIRLFSSICYHKLASSRLVFPHVTVYNAQGKKKTQNPKRGRFPPPIEI